MGIGKSLFESMWVIWANLSPFKNTHVTHIDVKRETMVLILAYLVWGIIDLKWVNPITKRIWFPVWFS